MFYMRTKPSFGIGDQGDDSSLPYSIIALGTTNANLVKTAQGVVTSLHVVNVNAAVRYLKLYDTNVLPTAGQGTPARRYAIPASATGAGFTLSFPIPLKFIKGIGFTLTTGQADNDTGALTAGDVVMTLEYI